MQKIVFQEIGVASLLAVAAWSCSMLLTWLLIHVLPKWGMVDKPDFNRRIHHVPIPRGGGLAIVVSFSVISMGFFATGMAGEVPLLWHRVLRVLVPLAVLVPLGILDDKFGLGFKTKFLGQILAAALAWQLGYRLDGFFGLTLPTWLGWPLTILWIVGSINAFNMIDGVDGLAGGIGIISAACMAVVSLEQGEYPFTVMMITLCFSILGFLFFNWPPAKVFMGDTGSMFLGYILAVSGVSLNANVATASSVLIPLLACGVPFLDITLAVWRRLVGGDVSDPFILPSEMAEEEMMPWNARGLAARLARIVDRLCQADQRHLHHRMLKYFNGNQRKTILNIYSIAAIMAAAALMCYFSKSASVIFSLIITIGVFSLVISKLAYIELWTTAEWAYHDFQNVRRGVLLTYVINPLFDVIVFLAAYLLVAEGQLDLTHILRYLAVIEIALIVFRAYRVLWNYVVSDDYFELIMCLIVGFFLAWCSDLVVPALHPGRLHFDAACLTIVVIMIERLGLHYFRNVHAESQNRFLMQTPKKIRTLLVGVSYMGRLYRNQVLGNLNRSRDEQLLGIVVLTRAFLRSHCFGLPVLGPIDELEQIIMEQHATKIVVMIPLEREAEEGLRDLCRRHHVALSRFVSEEVQLESIPQEPEK